MSTVTDRPIPAPLHRCTFVLLISVVLCAPASATGSPCAIDTGTVLIVPADCTHVISDTQSYNLVFVANRGVLELAAGAVLEIRNTLFIEPLGVFCFNADDGESPPILRAAGALEITGPVTVGDPADDDGGAGGVIASETGGTWIVLKTDGLIAAGLGPLDIIADIENNGTIRASGSDPARRTRISGAIWPQSSGRFEVTGHENAKIIFDPGSRATITGGAHFDVRAGTLEFNDTIETLGGVRMLSGKIVVAPGCLFSASGPFVEP